MAYRAGGPASLRAIAGRAGKDSRVRSALNTPEPYRPQTAEWPPKGPHNFIPVRSIRATPAS
jgi:hypothetical protein